jgi:hypothetical protein
MAQGKTQGLLDELVHQFADPFAFYRELIQNSLDAGSTRIEVSLQYRAGPDSGRLIAQVRDWGEGMNRDIIENYLLTKFRSRKENDLTKIGKFGIGFLSVFSPQPECVAVDTGREGESWRVLFHADKSYELLKRDEPHEGTAVSLHKTVTAAQYRDFVDRSFEALRRWCRYASADITFAAADSSGVMSSRRTVSEPFTVNAPYVVEHSEEGLHIVAGPARKGIGSQGFYNRGLTLFESLEPLFEKVDVRIESPRLEHTLARDNVRRDETYEWALKKADSLVNQGLRSKLSDELAKAAVASAPFEDYLCLLKFAVGRLAPAKLTLRGLAGKTWSGPQVRSAAKRSGGTLWAPHDNLFTAALTREGVPLLIEQGDHQSIASVALDEARSHSVTDALAMTWPAAPEAGSIVLLKALERLKDACGLRCKRLAWATVQGFGEDRPAICVDEVGRSVLAKRASLSPFGRGVPDVLVINAKNLHVGNAAKLAQTSPRLAALLVWRLLLSLESELSESVDAKLTQEVLSA